MPNLGGQLSTGAEYDVARRPPPVKKGYFTSGNDVIPDSGQLQNGFGQSYTPDHQTYHEYQDPFDPSTGTTGSRGTPGAGMTGPVDTSARDAAFASLASEIRNSTGYTPSPITSPGATPAYDPRADQATYARAKDHTGLALQASLKGLRNAMASRGLSGSGMEAAATSNLFGQGLQSLGETDRGMAEATAGRAFSAGESARSRDVQVGQLNESNKQAQSGSALDRLRLLLQTYGAEY